MRPFNLHIVIILRHVAKFFINIHSAKRLGSFGIYFFVSYVLNYFFSYILYDMYCFYSMINVAPDLIYIF